MSQTAFILTPEVATQLHGIIFSSPPSPEQARLYASFPEYRGFSDKAENEDRFQAVLHLALLQTVPKEGMSGTLTRSYLLFPRSHQTWAMGQIKSTAERIYAGFRATKQKHLAKSLGKCFEHMMVGHHVLQMHGEPAGWNAFGFATSDPIPSWLRSRLLT